MVIVCMMINSWRRCITPPQKRGFIFLFLEREGKKRKRKKRVVLHAKVV